jgi:response regulator RpfG family c-di-GMP phosphodiesterase
LTLQEARSVIERDAGSLWNPEMVRIFLDQVLADELAHTSQPAAG